MSNEAHGNSLSLPKHDSETAEINEAHTNIDEEDIYHDPDKLLRISTWANNLSWLILGLSAVWALFRLIIEIIQITGANQGLAASDLINAASLIGALFSILYSLLIGFFYFVVLQAISEGIYILMDIQDKG